MQPILKLFAVALIILAGIAIAHRSAAEAPQASKNNQNIDSSVLLVPGIYDAPRPIFDSKSVVLEINQQHYGKQVAIKDYAHAVVTEKWGESEWKAFDDVVKKESHYDHNAVNPVSGACGIPQALPCSKLGTKDPQKQVDWMVDYIDERYGSPSKALAFHLEKGWY